jgi:O-antigen/teichoic acid export membrane protein
MADKKSTSTSFKSFGKDTLLYVPYRVFPVLFGFIGLWLYTRIFSLSDYGIYSLLNITIGLLGILAYSWIDEANLRFYFPYKNENRLKTYFTTSFVLQAMALVVISVTLAALGYLSLLPSELVYYLELLVGAMIVLSFFETVMTFLQPERKVAEGSVYRMVSAVMYLAVSLIFIFVFNFGIASILLGYIVTNSLLTVVIMVRNNYFSYLDAGSFSVDTAKEFVIYGLPLVVQQLFYWVLVVSDRYIINFFRGSQEVGIYSAAYQLADYPISMFTSMMLIAAFPIILNVWEKKGEEFTKPIITGLMRYYLLFVIPAFVGVTLLSTDIMVILTDDYSAGFMIVPFVCLSKALYGVVWYLNIGMRLKKKTLMQAVLISIAGIIDIILNLWLVPSMGFVGAGISLGVSYTIYCLLTMVVSQRYLKWAMPWGSIKNILIATAVMGAVVLFFQQYMDRSILSLVVLVGVGSFAYLCVILVTGEVRKESEYFFRAAFSTTRKVLNGVYGTLYYSLAPLIR